MSKKKSLVLVDGSYYMFRAFHAMPDLRNADGEPTSVIYGVVNMLRRLIKNFEPDFFAVVFDPKGKTFRNDLYADYKANRPPMDADMACQIAPLHEIIRSLGIPLLIIDGVEADDVIATLAVQAEKEKLDTTISTGDKDLAQLVNRDIRLINTMSDTVLDQHGVMEKFGVRPDQIVDYLTLVGDTSDNIPGVNKVGPKTAAKWLAKYDTLDTIIEHADEIGGKVGEYLRDSLEQLPLSKELVTLRTDIDLDMGPTNLIRCSENKQVLQQHYTRWGFRSWISNSNNNENRADNGQESRPDKTYQTIFTRKELSEWIKQLKASKIFAIDTETTSLDYMDAKIVGISLSVEPERAAYIPVGHDYADAPEQLSLEFVLQQLKPVLHSEKYKKVGQNIKYDMSVLANYDISLQGVSHDTMLQSYVLDSTASRHDMDSLAKKYLDINTVHYEDIAGKGAKQIPFSQVAIDTAANYAAEDADVTLRLHNKLWSKLSSEKDQARLYQEIEIPLIEVLSVVERNGVAIDVEMLKKQSRELSERMLEIEQRAHDEAGQEFNIGSPKQIQTILYEHLNMPVLAKTPKGQPSTAESVLQDLAQDYFLPQLILEHRSLSKLKSTYTDKLPEQINKTTGRVHTSYHQAVAATGRLSSSDPNLQNIPIRTDEGRRIRQAFIASPGYTLLAADYSQIELRIMAHLSGDKSLVDAFSNNEDIHRATAAEVFETDRESVTSEQRRAAKAINFGLIYGMSAFGLARQLGIDRTSAKDYVERYFQQYPSVKNYMDEIREKAKKDGFVETVFKRRLYLPEINARNAARRQYAERTAINAPMQGTAADIIKRAMIDIHALLINNYSDTRMIMQVHDELVFEVPIKQVDDLREKIIQKMSKAAALDVPLVVDTGVGDNWDVAH